jgi:hypothetical protein
MKNMEELDSITVYLGFFSALFLHLFGEEQSKSAGLPPYARAERIRERVRG